jgi:hypothetical protein
MRYVLVEWPESQKFMDVEECILSEDGSYFVPEDIYYNTIGFIHPFSKTVKNGELQDILSQYPKDAVVAVEYCDVKNLKYFPDRNFIAID